MKTKFLLLSFFAIVYSNISVVKAQAVNVQDSLALVDLYNSTKGTKWKHHNNWLTGPVNTWYGVIVANDRVTELHLSSNSLNGTLPASIGNLTALVILDLRLNLISGIIPVTIGNFSNLQYLYLDRNNLTGNIPSSIGNLTNLQYLYLNSNKLSGSIPASIGNLTALKYIFLYENNLSGAIPSSIGNLTNVITFDLHFNQLSGSIPNTIGNLSAVQYLYLSDNNFSGAIPSSIGNLTNVDILEINSNGLSGNIPSSIGNLTNVERIILNNNQLSGSIPASVVNLKKLMVFNVGYNQLSESSNVSFPSAGKLPVTAVVSNNNFTFNGLEAIAQKILFSYYSPQALIHIHLHGTELAVYAGGTLSNNTYNWYKVGESGSTAIAGDSTFQPTTSGQYYATVTNAVATKLTLYTDTVNYTAPLAKDALIVSVYPNPVRDILNINGLDGNSNYNITVADGSGHAWLSGTVKQQSSVKYNVSRLKLGYYVLNVSNGITVSQVKFMKE